MISLIYNNAKDNEEDSCIWLLLKEDMEFPLRLDSVFDWTDCYKYETYLTDVTVLTYE